MLERPRPRTPHHLCLAAALALTLALGGGLISGCGSPSAAAAAHGRIVAVGAENEYANVISQVGGRYVDVSAVESNPNTDPHTYEASPSVARTVGEAQLVVQNGVGYDEFMNKIEGASHDSSRRVVEAQKVLGLPDSTANPHLWYDPRTMPAVARAIAADLSAIKPSHRAYFTAHAATFIASLGPWNRALAQLHATFPHATVATTEPVADDMLQAARIDNLTPFPLQADIMNDTDPAPQAVSDQSKLFSDHRAQVFVYNQQVTDSITNGFLADAKRARVPVVGVYETMPAPGYDYQSWMMAETRALQRAFANGTSTRTLVGG